MSKQLKIDTELMNQLSILCSDERTHLLGLLKAGSILDASSSASVTKRSSVSSPWEKAYEMEAADMRIENGYSPSAKAVMKELFRRAYLRGNTEQI